MLAEIVLTIALASNMPAYNTLGPPFLDKELRLNLNHNVGRIFTPKPRLEYKVDVLRTLQIFNPEIGLNLSPYVQLSGNRPTRAGAEVELFFDFSLFKLGLYHHSSHNLDVKGMALEFDGIKLYWKLK